MASNAGRLTLSCFLLLAVLLAVGAPRGSALSTNYYASTCPSVESIVRNVTTSYFNQDIKVVGAVIRLLFHDAAVDGLDGSVLISSTPGNQAERDHPDNLSLRREGFDLITRAKAAVEAQCPGVVSCADILVIAARDFIALARGPVYTVELGRYDGKVSKASNVVLPQPNMDLNQQIAAFAKWNLDMTDLIALSAGHSVGLAHCRKFDYRLYSYAPGQPQDPSMDPNYVPVLKRDCPAGGPDNEVLLDPTTPALFDNIYYQNLQKGGGLLGSDEVYWTDARSKGTVNSFAGSSGAFSSAFITAVTKLGRVGVKTAANGEIRHKCDAFN